MSPSPALDFSNPKERHRKLPFIPKAPSYQPPSCLGKPNSTPDGNLKHVKKGQEGGAVTGLPSRLSVPCEAPREVWGAVGAKRTLRTGELCCLTGGSKGRRAPGTRLRHHQASGLCPQRNPDCTVLRLLHALLCGEGRDKGKEHRAWTFLSLEQQGAVSKGQVTQSEPSSAPTSGV